MIVATIDAEQAALDFMEGLDLADKTIARHIEWALSDTLRTLKTRIVKTLSKELLVKQSIIRKRVYVRRSNGKLSIWIGLYPVGINAFPQSQTDAGIVASNKWHFSDAFFSRHTGKKRAFIRLEALKKHGYVTRDKARSQSDGRLPIVEPAVVIEAEAKAMLYQIEKEAEPLFINNLRRRLEQLP